MTKILIEVDISELRVDAEYFSFKYSVKRNGKQVLRDTYNSSYQNGMSAKQWMKFLVSGEAHKLALEESLEQIL